MLKKKDEFKVWASVRTRKQKIKKLSQKIFCIKIKGMKQSKKYERRI